MIPQQKIKRAVAAILACTALAAPQGNIQAKENVLEAIPDAIDAYVYGYPLVTMSRMTRLVLCRISMAGK